MVVNVLYLNLTTQDGGKKKDDLPVGYFRARLRRGDNKLQIDVERMVDQNW